MKYTFAFLFFITALPLASACITSDSLPQPREYQVISAKGRVVNTRTGKALQRRSIFHAKDVLEFEHPDNRLAIIDHQQRSFLAIPDPDKRTGYLLEPLRASINTRPGKILNFLAFRQFLEGRRLLALGDSLILEIGDESFVMNNDSFFYVQYRWAADPEPVNKRLAFAGRLLIFDKDSLFSVDGRPIDQAETSEYALFYYNSLASTSTLINRFDIVFAHEPKLRDEVDIIVQNFNNETSSFQIRQAVVQYIENQYGEPLQADLNAWLARWWKL